MVRISLQGVDTMQIKPSASIRQNYNEIAALCKSSGEPVYLTKNGEGDLVVMDIETFTRREKMLKLREELLAVEEDRIAGRTGVTPDDLDSYLESIIDEVEHGKEASI
jgi:PHD/YefM family antitoxin component YafN of YafNO toxin-antitoxin module